MQVMLVSYLLIKRGVKNLQVTTWTRTKINFALLQSIILCLSRSRITTKRNKEYIDIELEKYVHLNNEKNIYRIFRKNISSFFTQL